jgi:hypothetical protein
MSKEFIRSAKMGHESPYYLRRAEESLVNSKTALQKFCGGLCGATLLALVGLDAIKFLGWL